jgi:hypothetical protein
MYLSLRLANKIKENLRKSPKLYHSAFCETREKSLAFYNFNLTITYCASFIDGFLLFVAIDIRTTEINFIRCKLQLTVSKCHNVISLTASNSQRNQLPHEFNYSFLFFVFLIN